MNSVAGRELATELAEIRDTELGQLGPHIDRICHRIRHQPRLLEASR